MLGRKLNKHIIWNRQLQLSIHHHDIMYAFHYLLKLSMCQPTLLLYPLVKVEISFTYWALLDWTMLSGHQTLLLDFSQKGWGNCPLPRSGYNLWPSPGWAQVLLFLLESMAIPIKSPWTSRWKRITSRQWPYPPWLTNIVENPRFVASFPKFFHGHSTSFSNVSPRDPRDSLPTPAGGAFPQGGRKKALRKKPWQLKNWGI